MSNATRWYLGRESLKRAVGISGSAVEDRLIDRYIEAASEDVERLLYGRRFMPVTATRLYPWPRRKGSSWVLYTHEDLLAITTLQSKAQDASPTTIAAADYFVEPQRSGPPYDRIEIDFSSTAAFEAGDTPQRSISVAGRWAYSEDTKAAGTLRTAAGLTAAATAMLCSDGSLIEVGDTLLIDTESTFVSGKTNAAEENNDLLNGAVGEATETVSVTVDLGTRYAVGEVIQVDSEKMLIEAISGNVLTVKRAYDGSLLASHLDNAAVNVFRSLTIVRGVNGTTAATHALAAAVVKYAPPADVWLYVLAKAILDHKQSQSGWTGQIGVGEGAVAVRAESIPMLREQLIQKYRPWWTIL